MTPAVWSEVRGDGPGVVLTHGAGDTAAHWDRLADALVSDHRVVRWDLPGHGRSAPAARYHRDLAFGALVERIAEAGPPSVLVGHSYGGYLGLAAAILAPTQVRALVLVATGPGFGSEEARHRWNRGVAEFAERVGNPAAALAAQDDGVVLERLADVRCPVLQICGARDQRFHAALEVIERKVPDTTTVLVEGAGHAVAVTHAAEVIGAIRRFLARAGAL